MRAVGEPDAVLDRRAPRSGARTRLVAPERIENDVARTQVTEPAGRCRQNARCGPPSPLHVPGVQRLAVGGHGRRGRCATAAASATATPRTRWSIEQGSAVEAALWSALEALEERGRVPAARSPPVTASAAAAAAIASRGAADDALERAELIRRALGTGRTGRSALDPHAEMAAVTDSAFEALLEFLKRTRGFDFTGYKRTSLSAASGAAWRRSAAAATATTSTTSRSTPRSSSSSSTRC